MRKYVCKDEGLGSFVVLEQLLQGWENAVRAVRSRAGLHTRGVVGVEHHAAIGIFIQQVFHGHHALLVWNSQQDGLGVDVKLPFLLWAGGYQLCSRVQFVFTVHAVLDIVCRILCEEVVVNIVSTLI